MDFPLYDHLVKNCKESKVIEMEKLYLTLNRLDIEHYNIIFLIIFHHYMKQLTPEEYASVKEYYSNDIELLQQQIIPYDGKMVVGSSKGLVFKLRSFPEDLLKIVDFFAQQVVIGI